MTQKSLAESREKTKPSIAHHESNPAPVPAPSPQGGFYPILQLQKNLGNRNIAKLIQSKRLTPEGQITGLQRKLTVGAADDQYEKEADQVARQVMNTPDAAVANSMQRDISPEEEKDEMLQTKPLVASITPFVQREMPVIDDGDKEEPIQAKSAISMSDSFEAGDNIENQLSQSKGQGSPLPDPVRSFMEPRFGVDFSQVRVHTGSDANQMNRNVGAQAFTHGSDIYFGEGRSPTNLELTAHELTHVVQQTGGARLQKLTVGTADDQYEQEADGVARQEVINTPDAAVADSMQRDDITPDEKEDKMLQTTHLAASITQLEQPRKENVEDTEDKEIESLTSSSECHMQRTCSACGEGKKTKESDLRFFFVQRTIGDGHDFLPASRFSGNATLEGVFDNERVLQTGSSGAPVTLVQQALIALGYALPRFGADGDFGDETRRAVDAFQRDVGLTPDGRVGFRTIDFLDKRDRGAEVAPPVRPVVANAPFNIANAIAQPGAAPTIPLGAGVWGLTFPENVQVTIDVFDNGGVWQPVLTGVIGNYSLQTRLLPGVTEVTGPAGNTTAANYCAQINDLDRLTHAAGTWFMLSAVLAHERVHARQFRAALVDPSVINPLETAIEAITTPVNFITRNAGVAEFFIRLNPAFTAALNAAQANWLAQILILVAADHTPGGTADTEEHAIVDPMRRRICQHARANGWPACPPLCP